MLLNINCDYEAATFQRSINLFYRKDVVWKGCFCPLRPSSSGRGYICCVETFRLTRFNVRFYNKITFLCDKNTIFLHLLCLEVSVWTHRSGCIPLKTLKGNLLISMFLSVWERTAVHALTCWNNTTCHLTKRHTDVLTNNACVKRRTALMHVYFCKRTSMCLVQDNILHVIFFFKTVVGRVSFSVHAFK